jgi:hypothetical protein
MDQSVVGKRILCRDSALGESLCPHPAKALFPKHSNHFRMPAFAGLMQVRKTKPVRVHHNQNRSQTKKRTVATERYIHG